MRITRERELADEPYGIWWGPSTYELPTHNESANLGRSVAVGLTKVINPTMTNEIVFSGSKLKLDNQYADPDKVRLDTLGLENLVRLPFDNTQFGRQSPYAPMSLISWSQGQLWSPGTNPIFAYNDSFSITDNLSKVLGSHTLKFGALVEQGNKKQNFQGDPDSQGQIEFDNGNGRGTRQRLGRPARRPAHRRRPRHGAADRQLPVLQLRILCAGFVESAPELHSRVRPARGAHDGQQGAQRVRHPLQPGRYQRGAGYYIGGDPFRPNGVLSAARGEVPNGVIEPRPCSGGRV